MKLYVGTTEQFRALAQMHPTAEKLRAKYIAQIGYRPAPSKVASWQNGLMTPSMLVDRAESAVVVELKQWSDGTIGPSTADNSVKLYVGKPVRLELHPSVQVGCYKQWLLDNHDVLNETDAVALTAGSYLHNREYDPDEELRADRHAEASPRRAVYTQQPVQ